METENSFIMMGGLFGSFIVGLQFWLVKKINSICERIARLESKNAK